MKARFPARQGTYFDDDGNKRFYLWDTPRPNPPTVPRLPGMTKAQEEDLGWVVERQDRMTKPTKRHPDGRVLWTRTPSMPDHRDIAFAVYTAILHGYSTANTPPADRETCRLRNVYTGANFGYGI